MSWYVAIVAIVLATFSAATALWFIHFPQSCVVIKSSVLFPVIENSGWPPFTQKVLSEICKWFCQQFGFCICPRYFTWSFRSSELDCRFPAVSLFVVAALGLDWNQRICSSWRLKRQLNIPHCSSHLQKIEKLCFFSSLWATTLDTQLRR